MAKRVHTGMSVGGSSILLIFVLLSLTTFAALSLVSANADYKLSDKNARAMQSYYAVDAAAEEKLQEIDKAVQAVLPVADELAYYEDCARALATLDAVFAQGDADGLTASYAISDHETKRELQVELRFARGAGGIVSHRVTSWRMSTPATEERVEESQIKLWDGNLLGN